MWKGSKNPQVLELTASYRDRSYRLSDFNPIKLDGINKNCIWCLKKLSGNKHKWCSTGCVASALAWAKPNGAHGLKVLLYKNNFKCAVCGFSYRLYFDQAYLKVKNRPYFRRPRMRSQRIEYLIRAFRKLVPRDDRPEIDHVISVALGGQTLGFENLQLLCCKCHKVKSKKDLKDRMAVKGNARKGTKFSESHRKSLSLARKGFDSPARKRHREKMYEAARIPIIATNLSTGEERCFASFSEAAYALNLQKSNISRVLSGDQKRKQHKGWTFKYK